MLIRNIYPLVWVAPSKIRRYATMCLERRKQEFDQRNYGILYGYTETQIRLNSHITS